MLTSSVFAQSSASIATSNIKVSVPLSFVIQAEKNADELAMLRLTVESKNTQLLAYAEQEKKYLAVESVLQAKITSLEVSVKNAETALAKSQTNVGLTEQQKALFQERLNEYKVDLTEARSDLKSCQSSRKWLVLGSAAVGFGAGVFTK